MRFVLSILRIVIGLLILEHGMQKLFHFPPPDHSMGGPGGLPPLTMVAAESTISACQHWKARPLLRIRYGSFQLLLPVALCFVFLDMAFAGGGRWSVDAMWRG
ncbi:MAG: DoxX family membrane protein [Chthoniobacterales bacterium]